MPVKKWVFSVIVFSILNGCASDSNSVPEQNIETWEFVGIKESYSSQEPIEFSVRNKTGKTVYFYCTVEEKIKGNWKEAFYSIDQIEPSKSIKMFRLKPNESHDLLWDHTKQDFFYPSSSGVYRFKIYINEGLNEEAMPKYFSKEFQIK